MRAFGSVNPIPTGHGWNQPIYECHVTTAGRNRVNEGKTYQYYQIAMRLSIGFDPIVLKQEMKAGI